ncbi:hypothetical protein HPB49_014946 [Dermacentor silvarum]|uniref:Uncharacterized protein n=1 Tax=Dermacentor silvarum TaxID=543639 RepID=A0ACB8C4B5_DERSI|nr:hypothetical protein HPB49_014946 [Dermacentor silvarum]
MSVPGLQPPPPFLPSPGHPAVPWDQWKQAFEMCMLASGASGLPAERRGAILLTCLAMEGQQSFSTLKSAELPSGSGALLPLLLLPALQMLVTPCRRRKRMTLQSPCFLTISSFQSTSSWLDTGSVAVLNVQLVDVYCRLPGAGVVVQLLLSAISRRTVIQRIDD